ncbi:unnamed protein product [Bursaphelenchus xylophilus]|uniref:(pine wood nematode) hypothetical protein n=1 Tax=Bursaphelenchus xylophilus TaxID=6326 RepID=A0A1I7SQP3_BURXY|nr:unnamed protein product [Bursaphelenchus xylophilus]CAG9110190.1 unnamed protein product [Bursaphelenchus xylophilus]
MDLFSRPSHQMTGVKVPANQRENRELKAGFDEDDNEDIAYLNFRLLWPLAATTVMSIFFLILTVLTMNVSPHTSFENFALNQLFYTYGKNYGFCNNTNPYEEGMYPSILRHVEMKVICNVFFRVAVCVPLAFRLFIVMLMRNDGNTDPEITGNIFKKTVNEVAQILGLIGPTALSLFSIITIRFDFPEIYRISFSTFIVTTTVYMVLRFALAFGKQNQQCLDSISFYLKGICMLIFIWTGSKFLDLHMKFISDTGCHAYVSPRDALNEYFCWGAYFIFHMTNLIDVRDLRFICYPRTCAGECEPLRPENFRKGAKYEHCRAYELRQRQLLGR